MKDFMIRTYRGRQFEFKRVLSSASDPWYHISVTLDDTVIQYRMHPDKDGIWKIPAKRLPSLLYSLENEFNELLKLNERPVKQNRLPDHYNTD